MLDLQVLHSAATLSWKYPPSDGCWARSSGKSVILHTSSISACCGGSGKHSINKLMQKLHVVSVKHHWHLNQMVLADPKSVVHQPW